jgi:tetratricopeptide (TPR) repeat protein
VQSRFPAEKRFPFCLKPPFEFIQAIIRLQFGRVIMQKVFIIFAVIVFSSSIATAQLKMRDFQTIREETDNGAQAETISAGAVNFAELNALGVKKALIEKNYPQAIEFFSKAVAAAPDCFQCKFNLGRSLFAIEKYDEAIRVFNELIALNPKSAELNSSLGEAFYQKHLYEESLGFFREAVKLNPSDAITLSNYAISLSRLEKFEEALRMLDQALKINPGFAEAYGNRGYALYRLGRQKEALEALRKAEKIDPNLAQVHNNLGVVLDYFGKQKEARAHYLLAVKIKPDYAEGICNLAISYLQNGERDAAYEQLKRLEKVDSALAELLRTTIWSKYVVDASKVKAEN